MSAKEIQPVDSKQHMLNPTDIFLVAAHENKSGQKMIAAAAKKAHVSPERMFYTVLIQEYSLKALIRIREGNTLYTIAAVGERVGFVKIYDGDIAKNYTANISQFILASKKIGFDYLTILPNELKSVTALKLFAKEVNLEGVKTHFDKDNTVFTINTGRKGS
jgi:hypothetical protein